MLSEKKGKGDHQMAVMDSLSPKQHLLNPESDTPSSKKRKAVQKTVISVKIGTKKAGKLKNNEGPPPDFWSWRKYGQKPIKGSPYPRGYYRCSTSKGCSAKKQVERSRTDESMFIITYTSAHNHPGPSISTVSFTQQAEETQSQPSDQGFPNQEQASQDHDDEKGSSSSEGDAKEDHHNFQYSPLNCSKGISVDPEEELEKQPVEKIRDCLDEEQISCEENDFFDDLEELPTPPSFSSFMRSYHFDEIKIHGAPS